MLDKIRQFIKEKIKWNKAGSPYRTEEEIGHIFKICSSNICGHYEPHLPSEGKCGICGCRLTSIREFWSKNSWATTNCPYDPPYWTENLQTNTIEVSEEEIDDVEKLDPPPEPEKQAGCGCGG